jgi:hypothetical protein
VRTVFSLRAAALAAMACYGLTGCASEASRTVLETQSPSGRYTVRLFGQPSEPTWFHHENYVYVDALRGSVALVLSAEVHYAGFLDSGFHNSYDPATWVADNVLRFPTNRGASTSRRDELWVENATDVPVDYLRVMARDMFLMFDVPPRARLHLDSTAFRATGDGSWFTIDGRRAGSRLAITGHDSFTLAGPRSTHDRYDILISQTGVTISHRPTE